MPPRDFASGRNPCGGNNQHTEKVTKYIKKTKEKSEYVTVPKQFKTNEFQNGMFLKPSSDYKYRGDNLQHSASCQ